MKVTREKIPDSQVVLTIEVPQERLEGALDSAYRRLAQKAKIPGFRPGKAPRALVEQHYGRGALVEEALDRLVPQVYREAIEAEADVDPIDLPMLEVETVEPLVVKATVPVRPTMDIGDYSSVRVARPQAEAPPERVEELMTAFQKRYATFEPVDRAAAWGDIIRADVHGQIDEHTLVEEKDIQFKLEEGRVVSLPGFAEKLIGLEKGADLEFDVPVPEEAPDERLAGKTCRYNVTIHDVKQEVLPELNDEFVKGIGEGFESLEAFRQRVEDDLRQAEEERLTHEYHDNILKALLENATLEYPRVLVDREVDRLVRDHLGPNATREDFERYLQYAGKTEDQFREELTAVAEERVRRSLVLTGVAEAEKLVVAGEEIDAEIERLVAMSGQQAEDMRQLFSADSGRDAIARRLLTRKTLDRLEAFASGLGEEPAGPASEGEAGGAPAADPGGESKPED